MLDVLPKGLPSICHCEEHDSATKQSPLLHMMHHLKARYYLINQKFASSPKGSSQ
jgi:hypothetical protein